MNIFRSPNILLLFVFCFACNNPLPRLEGVDSERWSHDKNACGDARASMRDAIDKEKEKLLGLNQMEIVKLLGRPDQNELSKRNEKFFYYYLQPSPDCGPGADSTASRLVIRFNAVGLAKEALIE